MAEHDRRKSLALAGLVLLSVAAIAMSAATVANVEGASGGPGNPTVPVINNPVDPGNGTDEGGGNGNPMVTEGDPDTDDQTLQLNGCHELLASTPGTLVYFGAIVAVIYFVKRRFGLGFTLLAGYVVTPLALAVYFLRTQCGNDGMGARDGNISDGPPGPVEDASQNVPPIFLVGGFAVLFVGVAAALYFSTGSARIEADEDDGEEDEADVSDIAAAARAAVERLEARDADVDNEVYRAWWEMTQLLNVNSPETHTPGEFAEAAIDLGIDAEHVDALTTLFEEVRYGHRDPESREERAIEVFKQIEQYGDTVDDAEGRSGAIDDDSIAGDGPDDDGRGDAPEGGE